MPGCEICCAPGGLLIEVRQVLLEELPGDLGHDAGAIPRVCISRAGAAMLHAPQGCQGLQPVYSDAIHKKTCVCTEPDPPCVCLRDVKTYSAASHVMVKSDACMQTQDMLVPSCLHSSLGGTPWLRQAEGAYLLHNDMGTLVPEICNEAHLHTFTERQ